MNADNLRYASIMLLAGVGIPLLAALNARLGARIGSPNLAASALFCVAFCASLAVTAIAGGFENAAQLINQPRHLFLGGALVAFYVLSVTWVAPRFGVGNAVFFVLLGQMISAAAIDHFGLFGAMVKSMTVGRSMGIGLMAAGLAAIQLSS